MDNDALAVLQDLHFTEYEAKVYLTLLEKSPLTGYAVSLNSGVPRSKVYEVLGGLVERGEVLVSHESPAQYTPLSPEDLLSRRKRIADASFKKADKALKRYSAAERNRDNIWNISGREAIFERVRDALHRAERRALLEIWPKDAGELAEALRETSERGVEIIIVAYGDMHLDYARVLPHDASDEVTAGHGGRWVILSVDDREVVAGTVSLGEDSRAAWTRHPALVIPITEIIIHDLHIMEIMAKHRNIIEESFGPSLLHLRRRYHVDSSGLDDSGIW